jgi:Uma2 family endonuclease
VSTSTGLISFQAFLEMPDPTEGRLELHHGEVVKVPPVKFQHTRIRKNVEKLLEAVAGQRGVVYVEMPFRPQPDYEFWVADVALVTRERDDAARATDSDYFAGAPDIVVEVLSPPQDAASLFDKEQLCLTSGSRAFWIVDPKNRQVKVTTPDWKTTTYRISEAVPVLVFPGSIEVAEIFNR